MYYQLDFMLSVRGKKKKESFGTWTNSPWTAMMGGARVLVRFKYEEEPVSLISCKVTAIENFDTSKEF